MPSPEAQAAQQLLRAAAEDEAVVRELAESTAIGDSVIGFHAQQAVEKLLKAVLASRGIDYPFTHDVSRLLDDIGRDRLSELMPVEAAEDLTPWATELRYGSSASSELDRIGALHTIEAFRGWAEAAVAAESP